MKHLIRKIALLLLIYTSVTSYSINAMDEYHNQITVINKNNGATSTLQMTYQQIEQLDNSTRLYSVGMTTILNGSEKFKCYMANKKNQNYENYSLLRISDPHGSCKNEFCKNNNTKSSNVIELEVSDYDTVTILAKNENNNVIIKLNNTIVGSVQY